MEKFSDNIKKVILAGIGAVATTADNIKQKVQDVTGKKEAELSDEDISDLIDRMTPEQIRALKEKLAGSDDAQTESEEEAAEEEKAE